MLKYILITFPNILQIKSTQTCSQISAPNSGSVACTDGNNQYSKCYFACDSKTDFLYPSHAIRKCKCKKKKGCYWTKVQPVCKSSLATPEASCTQLESHNDFSHLSCSNENLANSHCRFSCSKGFTYIPPGKQAKCICQHNGDDYSCDWDKPIVHWATGLDKMCVPKIRFYKKWNFAYNKAFRLNRMTSISKLLEKRAKANKLAILNVNHGTLQENILKLGAQHGIYSDFCNNSPVDVCNGRGTCQSIVSEEGNELIDYLNGFICTCDSGWKGFTCNEIDDTCEGSGGSCNNTIVRRKREIFGSETTIVI